MRVRSGSKCETLDLSNSGLLTTPEQTLKWLLATSHKGPEADIAAAALNSVSEDLPR